jgi:hypothetical protein
MSKYLRYKHGEVSFTQVERFDNVEKAADPNTKGESVEIKVDDVKINFSKVKKEKDERVKSSSAKVQGSPRKETQKVSGDKGAS